MGRTQVDPSGKFVWFTNVRVLGTREDLPEAAMEVEFRAGKFVAKAVYRWPRLELCEVEIGGNRLTAAEYHGLVAKGEVGLLPAVLEGMGLPGQRPPSMPRTNASPWWLHEVRDGDVRRRWAAGSGPLRRFEGAEERPKWDRVDGLSEVTSVDVPLREGRQIRRTVMVKRRDCAWWERAVVMQGTDSASRVVPPDNRPWLERALAEVEAEHRARVNTRRTASAKRDVSVDGMLNPETLLECELLARPLRTPRDGPWRSSPEVGDTAVYQYWRETFETPGGALPHLGMLVWEQRPLRRWTGPWLVEQTLLRAAKDGAPGEDAYARMRLVCHGWGQREEYEATYRPGTHSFAKLVDSRGRMRESHPRDEAFFAEGNCRSRLKFICDTPILPQARASRYRTVLFSEGSIRKFEEKVRFLETHMEVEMATAGLRKPVRLILWWRYGDPRWSQAVYVVDGVARLAAFLTSLPPGAPAREPMGPLPKEMRADPNTREYYRYMYEHPPFPW